VRCALGNLERSGFIHVDAPFGAQQGHRVSVCNYATYQGEEADKGTEGISEGYHEGNTNKNGKKEKKVRQQELLPPNGGEGASGTCPGNVPDSNDGSTPVEQPLSERSGQAERVKTFKQWDRADIVAAIAEANQDRLLTPAECADFADYWLEPTPTGRTRMSLERTWDTRRRMQTALRVVFSKQRPGAQSTGGAKYAIVN